jgi:hypothetical protein
MENNDLAPNVVSVIADTFKPGAPPIIVHLDLDKDSPEKLYPYINDNTLIRDAYIEKIEERSRKNKKNNNTDTIE